MPKQIDYPRATLKNSLELAHAVDRLGGKSSLEMVAEALNKKVSGAFQALVGATAKYGLIVNKQGQLETTALFRNQKLAYSEKERMAVLSEAFMKVPLFREICSRFENKPLPVSHFEKLLVREFGVPDQMGSRVAKYFLDGAKQCNLIGPDHIVRTAEVLMRGDEGDREVSDDYRAVGDPDQETPAPTIFGGKTSVPDQTATRPGEYSVRITGPGMDSVIAVHDEEDLPIVRAMLKKVEKKLLGNPDVDEQ